MATPEMKRPGIPSNEIARAPKIGDLPNKPLVEAIFELRWDIVKGSAAPEPEGWSSVAFKFFSKVQHRYPEPIDLPGAQIPESMSGYVIRNQFRAAKGKWPLTQLGPGILSVNETRGYQTWREFQALIAEAVKALIESHDSPIRPTRIELRYVNSVPFKNEGVPSPEYLKRFLHTTVDTPLEIFADQLVDKNAIAVNANWKFSLRNPVGYALLMIANGIDEDGTEAMVWQMAIRSQESDTPQDLKSILSWLDQSHTSIDRWFVELTEGELLEQFRKAPNGTN